MRKIFLFITVSVLLMLATSVYAAVPLPSQYHPENAPTITGEKPTGNAPAEIDPNAARIKFTQRIVNVVLGIAGIVAIFFIVQNGFMLTMSGGREETVTQHKKGLMWAVVGLLLIILSYSILRFIISIPFTADEPSGLTAEPNPFNETGPTAAE